VGPLDAYGCGSVAASGPRGMKAAVDLMRPLMRGLGGFPSSWPLQDHKRPLGFRGLPSATDPQRPDDDFMGDGCLLIFKLPFAGN